MNNIVYHFYVIAPNNSMKQTLSVLLILFGFAAGAQTTGNLRNIISVSPIQASENTATGFGLQYEHLLGAQSKFSLYIPVAYSFGKSDPCDATVRTRMVYAYPGIKYYPAGTGHKLTYAIGPSLLAGRGESNCNCYMGATEGVDAQQKFRTKTEAGVLVNNSINIRTAGHLYIGSELGIGMTCINKIGNDNLGTDLLLQFGIKVGYIY